MIDKFDKKEGYCKQLGHYVPFKYCRLVNNSLPCHQVFNCWFEILPIKDFIYGTYNQEDITIILTPPPHRVESIISIAEKIYNRLQKTEE